MRLRDLKFIFKPSYWVMLDEYSKEWDVQFEKLLETEKFEYMSAFEIKLGGHVLWIKNIPYSCFHKYVHGIGNIRPSKFNIERALRKIKIEVGDIESITVSNALKSKKK